ncbi:Putative epimerase/dehydratase [gamma proteobacterium HdN1]|nr:Putative epimerase/dehydratase [gamma proteobacterium HdN1]
MPISRQNIIALSRTYKQAIACVADVFTLFAALLSAYLLRLETVIFPRSGIEYLALWALPIAAALLLYWRMGLYKSLVRFLSWRGGVVICAGAALAGIVHYVAADFLSTNCPTSVPVIFALLGMGGVAGTRSAFRLWFVHGLTEQNERVIIYGAGPGGISLVSALHQGSVFTPVALVDSRVEKQKTFIHGLYVYSVGQLPWLIAEHEVSRIFLVMENLSRAERAEILQTLESLSVRVQTVPSMADVISGRARILDLRDVDVEDLLGRDQIQPDQLLMQRCIRGKVVMVTGAGGSIGSELCRQIITQKPARLVIVDSSEYALYHIDQELRKLNPSLVAASGESVVVPLLCSVQKENRIEVIMRTFGVQTVYHAAAYKHVPMVEHNIVEGVRNNVFGTWYSAEAAIRAGVETFVLISTDKAVRPANVMGASKRMAELVLQGLASRQKKTRFCMVRFGNVLGSSGSVVPLFQEQILSGGPVTVTHPDVMRYFMSIPEAAQLVIQASAMGLGGEVFLLDMGAPVRIADLARRMVHLMGYRVRQQGVAFDVRQGAMESGIEIAYTGLRPGEKLYEELLIGHDSEITDHPRILKAREASLAWVEVAALMTELDRACHVFDCERVCEILRRAPTGFLPVSKSEDLVWQEHLKGVAHLDMVRPLASVGR